MAYHPKIRHLHRPRAKESLRHILFKVFCAALKTAPLSVKVSNIQSYLPKSQLDLALFVPGREAIELNLLLLLFDQSPESLSLCTVAYFTRELQQGSFKIYD